MEILESVSWLAFGFIAVLTSSALLWKRKGGKGVINQANSATAAYTKETSHRYCSEGEMRTRTRTGPPNTLSNKIVKKPLQIILEPSLCIACGSCETLAPNVFELEKDKMANPKALVRSENFIESEKIMAAAETCPTKAIRIIDRNGGIQVYP
jgi:ferredoxin